MGRASKIGSALYAALPVGLKEFSRYRVLTGQAFHLLRAGKTDAEALELLWVRQKDLVERGCAIAAAVYEGLGVGFRREWMLWAFAEEAMAMIEEGKADAAVLAVLWQVYAAEFEEICTEKEAIVPCRGMVVLANGKLADGGYPFIYTRSDIYTRFIYTRPQCRVRARDKPYPPWIRRARALLS
jgi:hypothetical protein